MQVARKTKQNRWAGLDSETVRAKLVVAKGGRL